MKMKKKNTKVRNLSWGGIEIAFFSSLSIAFRFWYTCWRIYNFAEIAEQSSFVILS